MSDREQSAAEESVKTPEARTHRAAWMFPMDDPVAAFVARNPGISASAIAFVLVVIEVLAAGKYRLDTALAIVAAADTPKVVAGVAVTVTPLLLPPAAVVLWAWAQELRASGRAAMVVHNLWPVLAFFAFFGSPIVTLAVYVGLVVIGAWFPAFRSRRAERPVRGYLPVGADRTRFWFFVVILAAITVILSPRPWVPEETVSMRGGAQVTGFVVGQSAGMIAVLSEPGREIEYFSPGDVMSRTECRTNDGWAFESIYANLSSRSTPTCP